MPLTPDSTTDTTLNLNAGRNNDEAIQWFARINGQNLSDREQAQFMDWLSANPGHNKAFSELENFWHDPDLKEALSAFPLSQSIDACTKRHRHRIPWLNFAVAASIVLILTGLLIPRLDCLQADYCTTTGEIRQINLADGSAITLSPQTTLKVSMQTDLRQITLLEGEAFFNVQRDITRPFIVTSRYSKTQVLGTRFNVSANGTTDEVSVISGTVAVSNSQNQPAILHDNDSIKVSSNNLTAIRNHSVNTVTAWTKGHLIFANASLKEVVSALGKYRKGTLIVGKNSLKNLKVSGRFNIRDTDIALEALAQTLPIHIYRLTPWLAVIG